MLVSNLRKKKSFPEVGAEQVNMSVGCTNKRRRNMKIPRITHECINN